VHNLNIHNLTHALNQSNMRSIEYAAQLLIFQLLNISLQLPVKHDEVVHSTAQVSTATAWGP